ncbi:aspartic proteinase [Coleophoma crateriformis]|uniref:Aspartic proteinase n=1 Tax=Coleophoma crateriformis TaxID=565419 RepID=A0A3D8QIE6_9HELO|nr:aspartic proteinase [Coleophoma crateriformis]
MLFSAILAATALLVQTSEARLLSRDSNITVTVSKPTAFKSPSTVQTTDNVLTLSKTSSTGSKARSAARLLGLDIAPGNSTGLISLFVGEEFATNITFGTTTLEVIVDTGSSDTWLVETGFSCVDVDTGASETEDYCAFGPTYDVTSGFKEISGEEFSITYGDGEYLDGVVGYQEVTLAGITVNQTVALVNYAAWYGDSTTSGLVGLAYPALTSAYSSKTGSQIVYNPIFTTMYEEGLIDPLFSLIIERDVSGPAGYLALGGVPPVNFTQNFTSTPILITSISGYPVTYDFYTIEVDDIVLDGAAVSGSGGTTQYIVDSGTTLNYFPTAVADAVNAAFSPAAVYSDYEGAYIVDCNAVAPSLGIQIGGTIFYTNPLDMILLAGTDSAGNDVCISGIDDGGSAGSLFILGDTFQKNVVTVFDVGAVELKFASREFYDSNDTY